MGRRKKTRSIVMFGRGAGHTYGFDVTVSVYVNGVFQARLGPCRGGDSYAFQMGKEWLDENGFLPGLIHHENGNDEGLSYWAERNGCSVIQEFAECGRMRDI